MQNVKMSGKMIQKKASELAKELEIDFRASNRWLEQFCLKYNINFNSTDRSNIEVSYSIFELLREININ